MIDTVTTVGFIASVASLILAVIAIWLAYLFYRLSREESVRSSASASGISDSVSRLEKVFDLMYKDNASLIKDTFTDMRQVYSQKSSDAASSDAASPEVGAIMERLDELTKRLGMGTDQQEQLRSGLEPVVRQSVARTEQEKIKRLSIAQRILTDAAEGRDTTYGDLQDYTRQDPQLGNNLFAMRRDDLIDWDTSADMLHWDTVLKMTDHGLHTYG